jgi:hypothetical protein
MLRPIIGYGWYSINQYKHNGLLFIYEDPDCNQVSCTVITKTNQPPDQPNYIFRSRGPVTRFIERQGPLTCHSPITLATSVTPAPM